MRRIRERLRAEMRALRGANAAAVIARLNPIIRGWAAYYRTVVSSEMFTALDSYVWKLTYKWAKHSHPNKPKHWIVNRYFGAFNKSRQDRWVFGDRDSGAYLHQVRLDEDRPAPDGQGTASPDDPALADYWARRRRRSGTPRWTSVSLRLLQAQHGRCPLCGELLLHADQRPQSPARMGTVAHASPARRSADKRSPLERGPARRTNPSHLRLVHARLPATAHAPHAHSRPSTACSPRPIGACLSRMRGKSHVRF